MGEIYTLYKYVQKTISVNGLKSFEIWFSSDKMQKYDKKLLSPHTECQLPS